MPQTNFAADALRIVCQTLGLAPTALAKRAGIDPGMLSDVYNGRSGMTAKMLERLLECEALNPHLRALVLRRYVDDVAPEAGRLLTIVERFPAERGVAEASDDERPATDELGEAFDWLHREARSNPALSRAVRNFARGLQGKDVVL